MALESEEKKDPIPPVENPPGYCGDPLKPDPPIGQWGFRSGRWIKEDGTLINIADIWHAIYNTVQKALRVLPIERNEVRWTTEADFNKGTHDKTQTIPEEGGGVSLAGSVDDAYAVYHLNATSGSLATDDSGNGRHGTLINMEDADWDTVNKKLGAACLNFGGTDEYVNCGDIAGFERTQTFSVEVWIKTPSVATQKIVSRRFSSGSYRGWDLGIDADGKINVVLMSTTGNMIWTMTTAGGFNDDAYHHICFTYNGSSLASGIHIYVDNVDEPQSVNTDNLSATIVALVDCQISGRDGANSCFTGRIDEAIIYDRELDSTEVSVRWNSGNGIEWTSGYEMSGTYLSNAYDSLYPNLEWDTICFDDDIPEDTTLVIKVRTGDCPGEWGEWSAALSEGDDIPNTGRFIQWKGEFATTDDEFTPKIYSLSIFYLAQRANRISP